MPDSRARVHPASYPGQQFVTVYVSSHKQTATTVTEQAVHSATSLNKISKLAHVKACKQYVRSNVRANSSNDSSKSKLSVRTISKKVRQKDCNLNSNVVVLQNKFSPLYSDHFNECDDSKHDANEHDEPQCRRKVHFGHILTKKTQCSRTYRTNVPYKNARHAVKTDKSINSENRMFTNPYRVSTFSTLTYSKSCFIQKSETVSKYCHKEFRRTLFTFDIFPRFLDSLKLSVSDELVQILLLKYGISISRISTVNVTETMTMLNSSDTLINCVLKLLLSKTKPSDATLMRVIQNTGQYLLEYNNLYGAYFTAFIDQSALSNMSVNNFDIDLLLLCGDVESNPGPPPKSTQSKDQSETWKLVSSPSMSTVFTSNRLTDCFGNEYSIIKMPGSGFCGFHCLAHSLIGNALSHCDIIYDCINLFTNMPDLFRQRTNFGTRCESSLTLRQYDFLMRDAIQRVQFGFFSS